MPPRCSICSHPQRAAIDAALVSGTDSYRVIASRFGTSVGAIQRHRADHITAALSKARVARERRERRVVAKAASRVEADELAVADVVQARQARSDALSLDLMAELQRVFDRVNLIFDACDRWLRDPDDSSRYEVGPRAEDVTVTYSELGDDGRLHSKKRKLSDLIRQVEAGGQARVVEFVETRHADPRELVLKAANSLKGQIELVASILVKVHQAQEVQAFQEEVLAVLNECEPGLRGTLLARLRERRSVVLAAGASGSES